jgi:hypothetical protein
VTVFSEPTEEALFDKVCLVTESTFLKDLALHTGAGSLCNDSEPLCACVVLSELICTCVSGGKISLCNSLFIEDVKTFVTSVLEDGELPCFSALKDVELLGNLLEGTEVLCTCLLQGVEIPCDRVLESGVPVGVSFFDTFGPHRISVLEGFESLFVCLMDVSELRLTGLLEDVAPFCTCVREGVDMLCTNLWDGVVTFCACLLKGV